MRRTNLFGFVLIIMALVFMGCGRQPEVSNTAQETVTETVPEPELIEIRDLSEAWDVILNNSTKEFIGGHRIDEGFMSFVTAEYGGDAIETIAAYANFLTPEVWFETTGKSIHVLWNEYCQITGLDENENILYMESASDDEFVMDFSGDLSLAENVGTTEYMNHQINGITDCFSEDLLEEMRSADFFMINNEFAYTSYSGALKGKTYTFKAAPGNLSLLNEIGVDAVGIANNHVYDYDETGFLDTLATLKKGAMPFVGAGKNLDEASKPIYIIANGRKIGILAATQIERTKDFTKEADDHSGGVLKCLKPQYFNQLIAKTKRKCDILIVFVHWGTEGVRNYGSDQRSLARGFVESGADAIIGGHTHCLQTVEFMDNVPIYYSLGNYYFSVSKSMPNAYNTGLAQLRVQRDGSLQSYFIPARFDSGVTRGLNKKDDAYGDIINDLNSLSNSATIDEDGLITKKQQ